MQPLQALHLVLSPSHESAEHVRSIRIPLKGDRGFESLSLHRRICCEPDFLALAAIFQA
jgi:hypothetical protein